MRKFANTGDKVVFKGIGGYAYEVPEALEKGLVVGTTYVVSSANIGGWSSYYRLENFDNISFNTVMFELVWMKLNINDKLYHPYHSGFIVYKVVSIRIYESTLQYEVMSTTPVGACGYVKLLVEPVGDKFVFKTLVEEYHYGRGLGDFVEGFYYLQKKDAEIDFYNSQLEIYNDNIELYKYNLKQAVTKRKELQAKIEKLKNDWSKRARRLLEWLQ